MSDDWQYGRGSAKERTRSDGASQSGAPSSAVPYYSLVSYRSLAPVGAWAVQSLIPMQKTLPIKLQSFMRREGDTHFL